LSHHESSLYNVGNDVMEANKVVITVNIYKEVRRRWMNGESQRSIARNLGISRNTVKKYCEGANVPWERKPYLRSPTVLTEEVKDFITDCLKTDEEEGTSKQRHTAKRIFDRLVVEKGFVGGETTIRAYVHQLKGKTAEAFIPLAFSPGDAVQIDWGEATIYLAGSRLVVNLFCARLCYSDVPFVIAYRRQNSESFLDGLVQAFEYFGGAPKRVIFDNAKVAVKDGFGANARATDSYAALAAHYGFEPVFCNIASGNEKGLVEGLVGFSRRNFCVPIPKVQTMAELNYELRNSCEKYKEHLVQGRDATVGILYEAEKPLLFPLPLYRYDSAKRAEGKVSPYSTVRFDTNSYSVPVEHCGKQVSIKAHPECIEIFRNGEIIASHQRCFQRQQSIYCLEHYLPLLERKGRAIFQAKPVKDNVPDYFLEWLRRQDLKPKQLVELLRLSTEFGFDTVMQSPVTPLLTLPIMPSPVIQDVVQVATVDLSAYDALCGSAKGVSA